MEKLKYTGIILYYKMTFWEELDKNLRELGQSRVDHADVDSDLSEILRDDSNGEPTFLLYADKDYVHASYHLHLDSSVIDKVEAISLERMSSIQEEVNSDDKFDRITNIFETYGSRKGAFEGKRISWTENPDKLQDTDYLVNLVSAIESANKTAPYGIRGNHPATALEKEYGIKLKPEVSLISRSGPGRTVKLQVNYTLAK